MLSTANITMQFGPKPLFENISVKFGEGNRYGLIGANGCGKSTFMKILGADLEPSAGTGMLAVFAQLFGARLALNELAPARAALLDRLFPDALVTRHDAAQIDDRGTQLGSHEVATMPVADHQHDASIGHGSPVPVTADTIARKFRRPASAATCGGS